MARCKTDALCQRYWAKLNKANLTGTDLNEANLVYAELNDANLSVAKLNKANLFKAELNEAYLFGAELNGADLSEAELNGANLSVAKLNGANLSLAKLNRANLSVAELNEADLLYAELNNANLIKAKLKDSILAYAALTSVEYAPASLPPATYVVGLRGLETVTFPPGEEVGLVQLRKLLQDGGLRDLERQATYAIEHGNTRYAIANWNADPAHAAEGVFRFVAFDLTTRYGLNPGRALLLLLVAIGAFGVIYAVALLRGIGSIYRIRPPGRLEERDPRGAKLVGLRWEEEPDIVRQADGAKVEPLSPKKPLAAFRQGLQFSLLSAFNLGWRELNVGAWIARLQTREYTFQALGWVRVVSGAQSLLSVYLLAIWALTYFGRPFQ